MKKSSFLNQRQTRFFIYLSASFIATRLIMVSFFAYMQRYPAMDSQMMNDNFHHYQVALVVLLCTFIWRKKLWAWKAQAISLGVMLEESAVIVGDMKIFGMVCEYYLNGWDFLVSSLVLVVVGTFLYFNYSAKQKSPRI